MPFDFATADYAPPSNTGPGIAVLCALAVIVIGFGSALVLMFLRARELTRIQAREHAHLHEEAEKALYAGPGHVVSGRVELDRGEEVGVRIDIVQQVRNHTSKNSRSHTWEEISRTVVAAPFYLVREGGKCIYVEPNQDALVVDTLETLYPIEALHRRVRRADVRAGEDFFAYGDLHEAPHPRALDAYRGGGVGWVLRPPPRGRMLLATEGIRDRYQGRIRFLRVWGGVWAGIFCLLHACFTLPFVLASVLGTHTSTTVTRTNRYTTRDKHGTTTHNELYTRSGDGFVVVQEVPYAVYAAAREVEARGGAAVVPLVRTNTWTWASYVGGDPYISSPWLVLAVLCGTLTAFLVALTYRTKYAWYDKKTVDDPGGKGHWEEPRPGAPVTPGTD